ncbi:MAG: iron-sulfur cluster assembly accessory protein [Parvibaculum sp.]|nr:iron-sulfur cluster assembly accessory protein [Parvibaculum sp.]
MARPIPKAITVTEADAPRMKEIMSASEGKYIGVRIGVKNGGCAGMEYTMEYAEEQKPLDEAIEERGIRILIDPKAILFLLGTEMDYSEERFSSGFRFNNPNQTDACGCGESVSITPATI